MNGAIAERANGLLPDWARYQGYGTYALAGYVYMVFMLTVAGLFYSWDYTPHAIGFGVLAVVAWSFGSYYKGAAKIRVECDHCAEPAHGESVCPHCGELTYKGGNE